MGGAAALAAALSAVAASAPPALAPGTPGCTRQLLSSVASAAMNTFSLLRKAFLVPLCQRKRVFLQLQRQLVKSEEEGAVTSNF